MILGAPVHRQAACQPPFLGDDPEIVLVAEYDPAAVDIRVSHKPERFPHALPGEGFANREAGRQNGRKQNNDTDSHDPPFFT